MRRFAPGFSSLPSSPSLLWACLLGLTLIGLALRLYRLEEKDIWLDEGFSLWIARQDWGAIALRTAADVHPPLHYWLLHLWNPLGGESAFAVRFSTVFFGVLTLPLLYQWGRSLGGPMAGVVVAAFLSLARFHVTWSQELRMYALALFLVILSLVLFLRLLERGGWATWLAWTATNTLALYTLYLTAFVLLIEGIMLLVIFWGRQGGWSLLAKAGLAFLSTALLFWPWLSLYLNQAITWERAQPFLLETFGWLYLTVLPLGVSTELHAYQPLVLPFWIVALLGLLWSAVRSPSRVTLLLGLGMLLLPAGVYGASLLPQALFHPKITDRYLFLLLPFFAVLLALGLQALSRLHGLLAVAAFALLTVLQSAMLGPYYGERWRTFDLPALASFLERHAQPGDALVLNPDKSWSVVMGLIRQDLPLFPLPWRERATAQEVGARLKELPSQHRRVWLVTFPEAGTSDPQRQVLPWLRQRYREVLDRSYGTISLHLFAPLEETTLLTSLPPPRQGPGASLGDWTLEGSDPLPQSLRTGQRAYLTAYWRATRDTDRPPSVLLELLDAAGQVRGSWGPLASTEGPGIIPWPQGALVPTQHGFGISRLFPSGSYRLRLRALEALGEGEVTIPVATLQVRRTQEPHQEPLATGEALALLGSQVALKSINIAPQEVAPGQPITVSLRWQALAPMERSYTVFVHLLDQKGAIHSQQDTAPVRGTYPTAVWLPGEVVEDRHEVTVPSDFPDSRGTLRLGLYYAPFDERLPVLTPEGQETGRDFLLVEGPRVLRDAPR